MERHVALRLIMSALFVLLGFAYNPVSGAGFAVHDSRTGTATPSPDAATAVVSGATPGAGTATPAASPVALVIEMTDDLRFSPDHLTINVGQTVTWVNSSAMPHTATDDPSKNPVDDHFPEYSQLPEGADAWDSGMLQPGASFSYTFTTPGDYSYFCIPHVLSGMRGTITVKD